MEATPAQVAAFARALSSALGHEELSGRDLAEKITAELGGGVTPAAVSQWMLGQTEPRRERVFVAERILGLKPGTLARYLGYLPPDARPTRSFAEVVDGDASLSPKARRALRALYRELRD